jgi:CubicO group peptidase (beta-lactamase class C family)
MRLHEDKRLDLNAPISECLAEALIRSIHVYKGTDYSKQIKVYALVNQSSGIADYEADKPKGGRSVLDDLKAGHDRSIDTPEAMEIVRDLSPRFAPGTPGRAHYSNANYRLLGAIIESITQRSMAENFEHWILAPLDLQHTYLFDCNRPRTSDIPATIYLKNKPAIVPNYLASNVSDGGLVSTASECVIFLRAFFEGILFDKALLQRMMVWNKMFFPLRYGYGLMYFQLPRYFWLFPLPEFVGHSGSTGSFAFACPSRSLYLAGTINQIATPAKPFFVMIRLVGAVT